MQILRAMEKSDVVFFVEILNRFDSWGKIDFFTQISKQEMASLTAATFAFDFSDTESRFGFTCHNV